MCGTTPCHTHLTPAQLADLDQDTMAARAHLTRLQQLSDQHAGEHGADCLNSICRKVGVDALTHLVTLPLRLVRLTLVAALDERVQQLSILLGDKKPLRVWREIDWCWHCRACGDMDSGYLTQSGAYERAVRHLALDHEPVEVPA